MIMANNTQDKQMEFQKSVLLITNRKKSGKLEYTVMIIGVSRKNHTRREARMIGSIRIETRL